MRNKEILIKYIVFILLSIILIISVAISLLFSVFKDKTPVNPFYVWALKYHMLILLFSIILAIFFGFTLSLFAVNEINESKVTKKSAKEIVFTFLSGDEKSVINYLLSENSSTQSKIGKLNNMGRVRAHRCIQKLKEKNLVLVESRGKSKLITLKEEIQQILSE